MKDVSLKKMEERDKKKMDQLKKKLHTDDEGTNIIIIMCTNFICVVDSIMHCPVPQ